MCENIDCIIIKSDGVYLLKVDDETQKVMPQVVLVDIEGDLIRIDDLVFNYLDNK